MFECEMCEKTFTTQNGANNHMDALDHWECEYDLECAWCSKTFRTEEAYYQHVNATRHRDEVYKCGFCKKTFHTQESCDQHKNSTRHWDEKYKCDTCERAFRTQEACDKHMNATGHWDESYDCDTCDRTFTTLHGTEQHMTALGHWEPKYPCQMCGKKFHTQLHASQHMSDTGHWAPRFPCDTCGKMFYSQISAEEHMKALGHWSTYCNDCDRHFDSEHNLRIHLNSRIHRGKTATCPFCSVNYSSASGLTSHLESGSCPNAPGANRSTIHLMLRERDPNGAITCREIDHDNLCVKYTATHRAYNGRAWECYMCYREFHTVEQLNTHLNSPAHKEKIYHCPNEECGREFSTLAALFNHLERESCAFIRFEKVQGAVGDVLRGKMITFG